MRGIDEKRDMLALLSQELERKGVALLWNTPPERAVSARDTGLLGQVERWVANAPASFTYAVAAEAMGVIDNTLFRSYLKRAAGTMGYTMRKSLGYQSPMVFQRNEPDA